MNKFKQYLIPAVIIAIIALVGCVIYTNENKKSSTDPLAVQNISTYQECIDAGNPILESYPTQCKTPDGKSFTQEIGTEAVSSDKIRSQNPQPNQTISSPLEITGEAVGNWFFEASFPAVLIDANGLELATIPVTAQGEWMTTNFVPYKGTLAFPTPMTPTGTLLLKKDNPSGLAEHDDELRIPIKFSQHNPNQVTKVKLFFHNTNLDAECENTVAITREIPKTPSIGRATIEALIKGVTQEDKNKGYSTLINPGVKINSFTIENGIAKIDFSPELEKDSGGSCRALGIRSQITQTLKQFPTITEVQISVNGNTNILQP